MEEGEFEMEEGESEGSEAPDLVPIKAEKESKPTKEKSKSQPKIQGKRKRPIMLSDSDSFDSDEIEEMEEDLGLNNRYQGFVHPEMIDTYKMKKNERLAAQREEFDREEHRQQFKRKDRKGGGSTNQEKLKSKPF